MQSRLSKEPTVHIVSGCNCIRFTHGRLHSWGSQLDLVEGMETGESLSSSSPARSTAGSLGSEARSAVSSPQGEGSVLLLSYSEEVDVESVEY